MPNQEIDDFTALGAAPAAGDLIPIVDVSDTTDSPQGTTKKMTVTNLLAAVPGGGYNTIQDEGSGLTQRSTVDFVGAGVTVTDTGSKTQVSIPGGGGSTFVAGDFERRRLFQWGVRPGTTTLDSVGMGAVSPQHDSASNNDGADGHWYQQNTAASIGSDAGIDANHGSLVWIGHRPVIATKIKTGTSITDVRFWFGAFASSPISATDPTLHGMGFRYSTDVDGTAFWRAWSNDNSGGGLITAGSVAIAVSTVYILVIEVVSTTSVKFHISNDNGSSYTEIAEHTTNLPGAAGLNHYGFLRALAASAKFYQFGWTTIRN